MFTCWAEGLQSSSFHFWATLNIHAIQTAKMVAGLLASISITELLLVSVVFCLIFWVIESHSQKVPKGLKPLPGPWAWPLIGNMLTLGKNPHLALAQLREKYGDVMQIQIGSTPVLVLSGLETVRQALVRQGEDFKGRPDLYSFSLVTDGYSMSFNPDSGEVWAARRKLAQNALNTFSVASSPSSTSCYLEEHVKKEGECLIQKFQELMDTVGRFDPYNHVVVSVANVIGAMCFGQCHANENQELMNIITKSHEFVEGASSGNPVDFIPILRYFPNPKLQRFKEFNQKFLKFMQKTVQEHYKDFDQNNIQDITGALFKHSQDKTQGNTGTSVPKILITNLINDIFGAGFDTVTTAISWSLLYLVINPEVQKKIQKELDTVVGRERRPRLTDKPQLPYLEAFVLEMFRHTSFVPFTIPHSTTRATTLNNFYIPKGICVFVNQWQVNHDEKLWGDPSAFRPERFLSADGTINKNLSEKMLLFGMGKRRCIGETIARWEIFLFLAILLQQLEFSVPFGVKVDLTPTYGLTMKHPRCEHFQARQRFSSH
ncbi:cytochrome P450 1A2-like [Antechinus flavipes]|uniref:cytochrome P450 1A2-like n=1 Tax=Antechinus flavipes TaxID=38775 RepID=UPI002236B320|nr:cytochrome P450 1A2-like [Antechinus flavipes]